MKGQGLTATGQGLGSVGFRVQSLGFPAWGIHIGYTVDGIGCRV